MDWTQLHNSLDIIAQFTRYNSNEPEFFLEGLELAEDLITQSGILYTKGTEISPPRIARLLKLKESNPNLEFSFKLNRSIKLIGKIRTEIKDKMKELYTRSKGNKIYGDLLANISNNIDEIIDEILEEENIALAIFKMRIICENSSSTSSTRFFNHSLNVLLISLAIASSEQFKDIIGNNKPRLKDISMVAIFHNYGALSNIEKIMNAEDRYSMYWDENRKGYSSLEELPFSSDILHAIQFLCEYYVGSKDFINKEEWPAIMADIVLVADIFLRKESGLFHDPQNVRDIVDQLYLKMIEKEFNEKVIKALTLGLNLQDILDFYQEINRLMGYCKHKSAVPYPLTSFKSPTIFVCKKDIIKCKFIEPSKYSVSLFKPLGELKPGKYHRCVILTKMLSKFYQEY